MFLNLSQVFPTTAWGDLLEPRRREPWGKFGSRLGETTGSNVGGSNSLEKHHETRNHHLHTPPTSTCNHLHPTHWFQITVKG